MTKNKKQVDFEQIAIRSSNFTEIFNSMDDELLAEIAYYYPQQLYDLCIYLTLDYQMEAEMKEKQKKIS
jgi:hypothetical protein